MSITEKEQHYNEAARYLLNAAEILRTKAKKMNDDYKDAKYTQMACGTAYSGVLIALDTYLALKDKLIIKKKSQRKSVEDYRSALAQLDQKLLKDYNTAYNILHQVGYYDGETNYTVIKTGMEKAANIINKIKPSGLVGIKVF